MKKFFNLATILTVLFLAVSNIYSQNPVSGHVYFNDNFEPVNSGYVNAYDASTLALLSTANINPDGSYSFNGLPGIQIDVIGLPNVEPEMDGSFAPTYYPNKMDFLTATKVVPTQPLDNVDIYVPRLGGGINNAFGAPVSGTVMMDNSGLKDAIIYAMQGENVRGFAITDASGYYKIKNVPLGDYVLVAHRIGCTNSSVNVTVTSEGLKNVNFTLSNAMKAKQMKSEYKLNQNFPNPFNPTTQITYFIPKNGNVNISIYNINGQLVKELVNEFKTSGEYKVDFDGSLIASGVYFYTIRSGEFTDTKRLTLVK